MIRAEALVKEFTRPRRRTGRFATLRGLLARDHVTYRAVDSVDFTIEAGEIVGYLGPNGAGKSTTIKMLTGILVPTSGSVEVDGLVPWRQRERNARRIGVVFGQRSGLWWDLPLIESLRLVGTIYDIPRDRYQANLRKFSELLGLEEFLHTPVRQLSLGQRMRGDLAAAMLHDPAILFLDEPTIGLDVIAKERIRAFIADLNRQAGTTVVLTTHDLDDVERLCRRIVLIDHGRVLYDGDIARLKADHAPHRELTFRLNGPPYEVRVDGTEPVRRGDGWVSLRFDPARLAPAELIGRLIDDYAVADLSIAESHLEDVIARVYADRFG